MHALRDFSTTDYGLLSAAVIAVTLSLGVYFTRHAARHIREDGERAAREAAGRLAAPSTAFCPKMPCLRPSHDRQFNDLVVAAPHGSTRTAHGLTRLPCNGAAGHATARR